MKKKKKYHTKLHIFLLSLACIGLSIVLAISYINGMYKIKEKEKEEEKLTKELAILKDEEEKLDGEISRLQDPEYLARYARERYWYKYSTA